MSQLADEISIHWLEDPLKYTYLRECTYITTKPRQMGKKGVFGKLIGYSVHRADGSRSYVRRFWRLSPWDRDLEPDGPYADDCPVEAVLPASIEVGTPSLRFWPFMMRAKGYDIPDQVNRY